MAEMSEAIAHEMNQPLTAIAMYAQTARQIAARRPTTQPERLSTALDRLIEQTERAGRVVERARGLVKDRDAPRERVDVNKAIGDVVEATRPDADPLGIHLEWSPTADLTTVACDPESIQLVAFNLLSNAIEAMAAIGCRHGRTIRVSTCLYDPYGVHVAVADRGPGVDNDLVFVPFQTTKAGHLGLGLSICRSIVLDHNGRLDYQNMTDSDGDVRGAIFGFTLVT